MRSWFCLHKYKLEKTIIRREIKKWFPWTHLVYMCEKCGRIKTVSRAGEPNVRKD